MSLYILRKSLVDFVITVGFSPTEANCGTSVFKSVKTFSKKNFNLIMQLISQGY